MMELGSAQSTPKSEAEIEQLVSAQIAELHSFDERMKLDRDAVERIKTEDLQLKCESVRLATETRAILSRIWALI